MIPNRAEIDGLGLGKRDFEIVGSQKYQESPGSQVLRGNITTGVAVNCDTNVNKCLPVY
jgi:hypothetical protein